MPSPRVQREFPIELRDRLLEAGALEGVPDILRRRVDTCKHDEVIAHHRAELSFEEAEVRILAVHSMALAELLQRQGCMRIYEDKLRNPHAPARQRLDLYDEAKPCITSAAAESKYAMLRSTENPLKQMTA